MFKFLIRSAFISLLALICLPVFAADYSEAHNTHIPLNQPNFSDVGLEMWVRRVVVLPYQYDYENYKSNLQAASQYFTLTGWHIFNQSLQPLGNQEQMEKNKIRVSASIKGKVAIIKKGVADNHFFWKVAVPMQINYQGRAITRSQSVVAVLSITRVDDSVSKEGIAIAQYLTSIRSIN